MPGGRLRKGKAAGVRTRGRGLWATRAAWAGPDGLGRAASSGCSSPAPPGLAEGRVSEGGSRAPPVTLGRGRARQGTTGVAESGVPRGVPFVRDRQAPFPSATRDPGNQAEASVVREAVPARPPARQPGASCLPFLMPPSDSLGL